MKISESNVKVSKSSSNKVSAGRPIGVGAPVVDSTAKQTKLSKDETLRRLAEERQRLERQNEESKRRLEELRQQEMLIEEAANKGG